MKNIFLSFVCLFLISFQAFAQSNDEERWSVEGVVLNASNKEPINARIVYESIPYGSNIGFINADSFRFHIQRQTEYRINVEAKGFSTYSHEIGLHEFDEGHYFTVIELNPNTAGNIIRLENLIFALNKSKINKASYGELDKIVEMMNKNPEMVIQLEGHTDYPGNAELNLQLSEDRVNSVKKYLMDKDIKRSRIKTIAYGGTQPLVRSNDPDERKVNRRVEVRILSN